MHARVFKATTTDFGRQFSYDKTGMTEIRGCERISLIRLAVLTIYRSVTDRQTGRWRDKIGITCEFVQKSTNLLYVINSKFLI